MEVIANMEALKLKKYMEIKGLSLSGMARHIGRSRQIITEWVGNDATVELTEAGIKIHTLKVVHESQVKK